MSDSSSPVPEREEAVARALDAHEGHALLPAQYERLARVALAAADEWAAEQISGILSKDVPTRLREQATALRKGEWTAPSLVADTLLRASDVVRERDALLEQCAVVLERARRRRIPTDTDTLWSEIDALLAELRGTDA